MASVTEKLTFVFYFIVINLKLKSYRGLIAFVWDDTARQPLEVSAVNVSADEETELSLVKSLPKTVQ